MLISVACWGPWHTVVFCRLGAPSLLPQLVADDHVVVHTGQADWRAIARAVPIAEVVADVDRFIDRGFRPKRIQEDAWRLDIETAGAVGDIVLRANPDVLWGPTCLAAHRRLLGEGRSAIFQHMPRIDLGEADNLLRPGLDNRMLAAIALNFEHHLSWAFRADGDRYPAHAEQVNWRVETSPTGHGILSRALAGHMVTLDPLRHKFTRQLLLTEAPGRRLGVIGDSDDAIALSLTPADQDLDWVGTGSLDVAQVRAWLKKWPSPANAEMARRSYRLHAGDAPAEAWDEAERAADALADQLFDDVAAAA